MANARLFQPLLVGANRYEVVWMAHAGPLLNALTLPGLQSFTITLPKRLIPRTCSPDDLRTCVAQIALTNHRLYVLGASASSPERLWTAPIPLPAKRQPK